MVKEVAAYFGRDATARSRINHRRPGQLGDRRVGGDQHHHGGRAAGKEDQMHFVAVFSEMPESLAIQAGKASPLIAMSPALIWVIGARPTPGQSIAANEKHGVKVLNLLIFIERSFPVSGDSIK